MESTEEVLERLSRKRCPRKLKKRIIKECGRHSYRLWLSSTRINFQRKGHTDGSTLKTVYTGWGMTYNKWDGF